uniref:Aldehyde dehydrogenase domain-containing protein n=1 Tax=Alexandrium catenella TaxID=2925 RepID=A0A7S1R8A3_ALECA|mmetsp:Transcript_47643/g.127426  ORF Transcript_47643/g.127426 Transcript_47643/m.127426 type:complete len:491 (+) Transcript_47643:70-1542(+)
MASLAYDQKNHYINGEWVPAESSDSIDVTDSNTADVIAKVPAGTVGDINKAVSAAKAAFEDWAATPLAKRKEFIFKILQAYQARKAQVVERLVQELGCTKAFAENVQANLFEWHFGTLLAEVDKIQWAEPSGSAVVVKEPVGVIGCITPWNYPINQIALKIGPAILVGCTVVLKPSELTPGVAYLVAEAVHEAGLPKGVFNMVMGLGPTCGEALVEHPDVDMISFTGSTRAGKRISELAAKTLKTVRTELGGKSAALMLDDADFETSVPAFVQQLMNNSGQSCNALSRMLVPRAKYDDVLALCKDVVEKVKVGKADDPSSTIGPLVSQLQWDRVQGLVNKGIEEGARVVTGGPGKPDGLGSGYFVRPTIFADVSNSMTIAKEEIFGPVLSVIPYDSEEEGVKIANDTIYGLNNAVASADPARAVRVASKLRSGMVMVNGTNMDFTAPFGGYKQSGNAREWGKSGIEEFVLTKTVNVPPDVYFQCFPPEQK